MDIPTLRRYLDDPSAGAGWLGGLGVADVKRAHAGLLSMAATGMPLDLLGAICDQLAEQLPRSADADMALNNLDRFVAAAPIRFRWARCSSAIPPHCRRCCRSSPTVSTSATCWWSIRRASTCCG